MSIAKVNLDTALHLAAKYHHILVVDELINLGDNVRSKDRQGQTPLHLSVVNKSHVDLENEMLPNGKVYRQMEFYGLESLKMAICGRDEYWVQSFAKQGALIINGFSQSLAKMLLDAGADVNARDNHGCTPIQCAIYTGDTELVKILILAGANVNNQNIIGATALHDAVLCGNEAMVLLLLYSGARVSLKTHPNGDTALHWASSLNRNKSHRAIIAHLLECGGDVNEENMSDADMSPFDNILMFGDIDLIKLCIDRYKADLKKTTPLGHSTLIFAVHNEDPRVMNLVLESGIDKSPNNITALHYACRLFRKEYIRMLIAKGADVNAIDHMGSTPLLYVMLGEPLRLCLIDRPNIEEDRLPTIKLLLESGANVYQKIGINRNITAMQMVLCPSVEIRTEVRNVIIEYAVVLEAQTNEQLIDKDCLNVIKNHPEIGVYYEQCRAELTSMRDGKIKGTLITYLSVLIEPLDVMARYARNEEFVEEFEASDYRTAYPIYASRLTDKFKAAVERQKRIERLSAVLSRTLQFADPRHVVIEKICRYLDDKDVNLLTE